MGEDSKPVGRPAKKDLAYVKLDYFNEGTDAGEWIARAEECVDLLGHKGEDAAGYILYHIRGGAKLVADALSRRCEENNEVEGDDFKRLYEDMRVASRSCLCDG